MNIANPDSAGKFDFSQIIDRKGKDALSLEVIPFNDAEVKKGFSKIPMWIADMNFATAPTILDHITSRARHPAFGYFQPSDEYFDCIVNWQKQRNGVMDIPREAIGYENGVLGCFSSVLQAFTAPGDPVLFHAPTYIGFQAVMKTNGRRIVTSELIRDNDGVFRIDFEDCEKKIRENHIHLVVFCSPHNPTGRVWEKEEIARFCEICQQNNCIIFSDEIWSDLILKNYKHTPTQSVSEDAKMRTIAAYAPSKTFNLAGLIGSYHIIYNETLREIVKKRSDMSFYNNMNVLSMHALIGAYQPEGQEWLDQLREVLTGNVDYACNFIQTHFPLVHVTKPQGTYLLYLYCADWLEKNNMQIDELIRKGVSVGVIWQDGRPFLEDNTIRMNLALPRCLVEEAFDRLDRYVFN
ncbi:MAG: aminotransferase class I/II-fold pyridoxal phosphate-dependent enzyme [Lachnospiraceae bacterium]|jgi:cystathionine beta-lyase|nr:aminotransferase class I/II-fold pyridoxal phosphate-dependent enzyme [Lachnospiraceae bacterium]MCH4032009.1 aminotransferase class I/II-fold pyridoxal phosphate-dependent enzyme [Lachnospiraceae bacterium]MCH4070627.1 aminotransferase class I/II-fold pyridoxal phosphate-dependent enzyme [Lachnospiraceae bacterium]MCH4109300.1 aminotransferase class I/II-fold pyridoxal phosphate-dependent enzyme [Lachnospiraceae bacterium]